MKHKENAYHMSIRGYFYKILMTGYCLYGTSVPRFRYHVKSASLFFRTWFSIDIPLDLFPVETQLQDITPNYKTRRS